MDCVPVNACCSRCHSFKKRRVHVCSVAIRNRPDWRSVLGSNETARHAAKWGSRLERPPATVGRLPPGIDRKRLPKPLAALVRTDRAMRAPSDALEADLLATYARVLRNDAISIDDDFFLALGGYSLLAAQLVSELRKDLGVEVAIRDVYNHPTIAALAVHLRAKGAGRAARAPRAPGRDRRRRRWRAAERSLGAGGARAAGGVRGRAGAGPVPGLRGDGAAVLGPALHRGGLARTDGCRWARASVCRCWCSPASGRRCCCSAWPRSGS